MKGIALNTILFLSLFTQVYSQSVDDLNTKHKQEYASILKKYKGNIKPIANNMELITYWKELSKTHKIKAFNYVHFSYVTEDGEYYFGNYDTYNPVHLLELNGKAGYIKVGKSKDKRYITEVFAVIAANGAPY